MNNDHDETAPGWDEEWPTDDGWPDDWPDDDHTYSVEYAKTLIGRIMWADYAKRIRAELDNDRRAP